MKIIDASVICKWYIPEDGTPEALAILKCLHNLILTTNPSPPHPHPK